MREIQSRSLGLACDVTSSRQTRMIIYPVAVFAVGCVHPFGKANET